LTWSLKRTARSQLRKERGTIRKDWGGRIPFVLAYPNTYHVGMSSLGLQIIYGLLNADPGVVCERTFWEQRDGEGIPIAMESQRSIGEAMVVAFSISFELDYLHVVDVIRRSRIPLLAGDRDDRHPLLMAGGIAVSANPAPIAPFFDVLAFGDGEAILPGLLGGLRRAAGGSREEILRCLQGVPGLYIPPLAPTEPVNRVWVKSLDDFPTGSAILTPDTEFADMNLLEVARGCGRGCRFCLGGYINRPIRERSVSTLIEQARSKLELSPRVGLVGSAVSDYSRIEELVDGLLEMGARISISSLRADSLSPKLAIALVEGGARTLTIAPEAGSERLRQFINKNLTEEHIMRAVELSSRHHFQRLKLYFMIGLPSETDEDIGELISLVLAIRERFVGKLIVSVTPFVPKAQTPFQWADMADAAYLTETNRRLRRELAPRGVKLEVASVREARMQGVLARGDERLASALARARGASVASLASALLAEGLAEGDYLRGRSLEEGLPWWMVGAGTGLSDLNVG